MSLYKYILKRILAAFPTILGVVIITFFLTRALPGDPVFYRLTPFKTTPEEVAEERARMGLDKPIIIQFFIYMVDMFSGNWSFSFAVAPDIPVWTLIFVRLPRSLEFMFYSMILAIFIGARLGRTSGANINTKKDILIRIFTYFMVSVPAFVIVIFIMEIYVQTPFRLLPLSGYKSIGYPEPPPITNIRLLDCLISGKLYLVFDYIWHLLVPLSAMTIVQVVVITRHTRANMIEILEQDYINVARVKGCTEKSVIKHHAFKNAFIPSIMVSSMGFPIVLGGMIAVEKIYVWNGMGALFYDAIRWTDYPVIIATIFVFALVVVCANLIADIIIAMFDPRIKLK